MANNKVNHPDHYKREGVSFECWELSSLLPHPLASAAEYVFRYKNKNGVNDLKKALWWLQFYSKHEQTGDCVPKRTWDRIRRMTDEIALSLDDDEDPLFGQYTHPDIIKGCFWTNFCEYAGSARGSVERDMFLDLMITGIKTLINVEDATKVQ